jgi:hypothetical protein
LLAQKNFEGTITWGSVLATGGQGETVISVKGGKTRIDMTDPRRGTLTSIRDGSGRIIMVIAPRKAYYVMGNARELFDARKYEATGRKETVAGYPCEYYRVLDAKGRDEDKTDVCVTSALGFATVGEGGAMADDEAKSIRQQFPNGFMILKAIHDGKSVQVLKVEKKSLSDDLFAPPAGYTEIKMPGRSGN